MELRLKEVYLAVLLSCLYSYFYVIVLSAIIRETLEVISEH